jgi:PAS domain-containing protein
MADTQKVLIAYYVPRTQRFRIPKGLDLEDKTKVVEYWVRRDQLHIKFVDGSFKHIAPYSDFYDEKTPCEETIETDDDDDEDHNSTVEDEEEDEEDNE